MHATAPWRTAHGPGLRFGYRPVGDVHSDAALFPNYFGQTCLFGHTTETENVVFCWPKIHKKCTYQRYSIMNVEHAADPGFLAVSPRMTLPIALPIASLRHVNAKHRNFSGTIAPDHILCRMTSPFSMPSPQPPPHCETACFASA